MKMELNKKQKNKLTAPSLDTCHLLGSRSDLRYILSISKLNCQTKRKPPTYQHINFNAQTPIIAGPNYLQCIFWSSVLPTACHEPFSFLDYWWDPSRVSFNAERFKYGTNIGCHSRPYYIKNRVWQRKTQTADCRLQTEVKMQTRCKITTADQG